jgi:spermidine/putrescine transport system permease protein
LLRVPALVVIAVAFLAPFCVLVVYSLFPTQNGEIVKAFSLTNYQRLFEEPIYLETLRRSLLLMGLAASCAVALAFPFAYFVATKVKPSRRLIWVLVAVAPFWTSYLIRVFAWLNIFGDTGALNTGLTQLGVVDHPLGFFDFDRPAIVITFVYLVFPLAFLTSYVALERINPAYLQAASDLGARPWQRLTRIVLPLARSGLIAGFLFAFIAMLGDYITPTLIGGTRGTFFANLIVNQFGNSLQWGFGATLALVLFVTVCIILVALRRAGRVVSIGEYTMAYQEGKAPFLFAYSCVVMLFLYVPIVLLVLFSLNKSEFVGFPIEGLSFRWFSAVFSDSSLLEALNTSLTVASIAVGASLVIGGIAAVQLARSRDRLRSVSLVTIALPLFLPPLVLGLGIIISLDALGVPRGLWTVVVGHIVLTLPIVTLVILARLEGLGREQEDAAMDLGATPRQVLFRILLPQALPGVAAAAMIAFAVSMDEFILTNLVTGTQVTLPLYIFGSIRFNFTPELNALSALLICGSFVLIVIGMAIGFGRARLARGRVVTN